MKNWSPFNVKSPVAYDAYPLSATDAELSDGSRKLRAEMISAPPAAKPKRAIWIVHGMGQQVPFATLEQLAEGIAMAAEARKTPPITLSQQLREVQIGTTVLQRVELTFTIGDTAREVDLYECYWAPKTEGAVKLRNVVDFLWNGGSRGLINFFSGFQRALFGTIVPFPLKWRTPAYLLLTLAVLAALLAINAIILATGATIAGIGNLPKEPLVMPLTVIAGLVSAAAITFGVVLFLADIGKPARSSSNWGYTLRNLTWFGVGFTIFAILVGASLMALIFWGKWVPQWLTPDAGAYLRGLANISIFLSLFLAVLSRMWQREKVSQTERPESGWPSRALFYLAFAVHLAVIVGAVLVASSALTGNFETSLAGRLSVLLRSGWSRALAAVFAGKGGGTFDNILGRVFSSKAWVWPFLVLISAVVRKLMVQYVGDVTAYVASNQLDCFDELRTKIKALAKESLSAVYSAKPKDSGQFEYEKVSIVGHSLGSVIAYDTLNRLIADDKLTGNPAGIVDRTGILLTFGSPLDKTAFFFSVMGKTTRHIREELAAVVQPLIQDPGCREKIPWVNVYSRNDIVSGSLDFYDFPQPPPPGVPRVRRVTNVKDEDALIPLVAHVDYWGNLTVWNQLLQQVLDLPE